MIISHKYKYVFVGLPLAASTAISKELCEQYDGKAILAKHSIYQDFLKIRYLKRGFYSLPAKCNTVMPQPHIEPRIEIYCIIF